MSSTNFADIPDRVNATDIDAEWFNVLKRAGQCVTGETSGADVAFTANTTTNVLTVNADYSTTDMIEFRFNLNRADGLRMAGSVFAEATSTVAIISEEYSASGDDSTLEFQVSEVIVSGTTYTVTFTVNETSNNAGAIDVGAILR